MSTQDEKYHFRSRNPLAATCTLHGCERFVRVVANSSLDIAALAQYAPKVYIGIGEDIDRGFRTSDDAMTKAIHTVLAQYCNTMYHMSYLGKGSMIIYLPMGVLNKFKQEVEAIRELMQQPLRTDWGGNGCYTISAPVSKKAVTDKRGRERSVPVISHCFQQVRPLAVKYLREQRDLRQTMWDVWTNKPTIPLDWSY
jgi:hypothetical protein